MAQIVWPSELPEAALIEGYRETPPNLVIRSQMDAGVPKVRRRFTAAVRPLQVILFLSQEQVGLLDEFYVTTTDGGADRFEWTHPRTGDVKDARFTQPPEYQVLGPDVWKARLSLEIMPD